jgi:tetratricopeptide (TPR) repeat protein
VRLFRIIALLITLCVSASAGTEPTVEQLRQEVTYYTALLKQDGGSTRSLNALGFAYHRLQQLDEALDAYTRASAADPAYPLPLNNIGAIRLARCDYPGAEQMFRMALIRDPKYAKAAYNLAVALYHQGKYLEAYREYRNAKKLDPSYVAKRMNEQRSREKLDREINNSPYQEELLRELAKEQNAKR